MADSNFKRAKLCGAIVVRCECHNCYFYEADCSGTDLRMTDFSDANLNCANLSSADLTGALLKGTKLRGIKTDQHTRGLKAALTG